MLCHCGQDPSLLNFPPYGIIAWCHPLDTIWRIMVLMASLFRRIFLPNNASYASIGGRENSKWSWTWLRWTLWTWNDYRNQIYLLWPSFGCSIQASIATINFSQGCINLVWYNCCGWNSGQIAVRDLFLPSNICLIQEYSLFVEQLNLLSIDSNFFSIGVSGMDSFRILLGYP